MFFPSFSFSKAQNSKKNSTQKNIAWTWAMDKHAINHAKNHYMDMGS
jgi:hypothetical protein